MIRESIKTAPTVEEAKLSALLDLGLCEDDDFQIEVLELPQKKFLGLFGGCPAKVKISVEVPDEKKPAPRKEFKKEERRKPAPQQKKPNAPAKKETAPKAETSFENPNADLKETNEFDATCAYIKMMVTSLGIENCTVGCRASDEEIVFELDCGDDYGIVIGRRGETLDAIQYLARMSANRGISGYKRVSINIGNYREKREASLRSLAIKTATRAVKTGRSITLEPMNPYERRIIHTAVQEVPGAVSFSTGMDLDRRVVISTEERRNNRQRGGDRREDRRDNHRDNRREKYTPKAPAEGRAPKSDAAGTSLYGRIDVKKD